MDKQDVGNKKLFKEAINNFLAGYNKPALQDDFMQDYARSIYYQYSLADIKQALSRIRNKHTRIDANPLPLILETLESLGAKKATPANTLPSQRENISKNELLNILAGQIVKYAFQGLIDDEFMLKCDDVEFRRENIQEFQAQVLDYLRTPEKLKTKWDKLGITVPHSVAITHDMKASFMCDGNKVLLCNMSAYALASYINKFNHG